MRSASALAENGAGFAVKVAWTMGCANMLTNATGILQRDVRAQFGEDWRKGASDSVATHVPVPLAAAKPILLLRYAGLDWPNA